MQVRFGTTRAAIVLVHGGKHDSHSWLPTIDALTLRSPELTVLAVDLPGRRETPGDLAALTIRDCADSVVDQVERAGIIGPVVLVGHSMSGVLLPEIGSILGPNRVRRIVCVACSVPPNGGRLVDTLTPPVRLVARFLNGRLPRWGAEWLFCNGMTRDQRRFTMSIVRAERAPLSFERVDRSRLSPCIPWSWILTLRDRALPPARQWEFADDLGVDELVELDCCHDAMIAMPTSLAAILDERASAARGEGDHL